MKHFTVSCEDGIYDWLLLHPEINKSGLFQKVAEYMMRNGKITLSQDELKQALSGSN